MRTHTHLSLISTDWLNRQIKEASGTKWHISMLMHMFKRGRRRSNLKTQPGQEEYRDLSLGWPDNLLWPTGNRCEAWPLALTVTPCYVSILSVTLTAFIYLAVPSCATKPRVSLSEMDDNSTDATHPSGKFDFLHLIQWLLSHYVAVWSRSMTFETLAS